MPEPIEVLIASRSDDLLKMVQSALGNSDARTESLLMVNGNIDPLQGLTHLPDVLILGNSGGITEELRSLSQRRQHDLPVVLVFGDDLSADAVRLAVRAGVRDIVSRSEPAELKKALSDLAIELSAGDDSSAGQITAVMNAKGGSGGTFIASSIAHIAATKGCGETLIVDLDFQFGSLPHYFDVTPKRSLLDALAHAHEVDRVAIEAYTAEHSSGLKIMAPLPDVQSPTDFDINERFRVLLPTLTARFRHVVFDVPRHVDEVSSPILHSADRVLIVLQQSLPSVRDAVRLKTTLVRDVGIDASRIHAVINRHLKSGAIELQDIREALGEEQLLLVPNHFKAVGQAIDMGVPIAEFAPTSPVVKALTSLQAKFLGDATQTHNGAANTRNTAIERLKQWSPF